MKRIERTGHGPVIAFSGVLVALIILAGCTSPSSQVTTPVPVSTTAEPVPSPTPTATTTADPFPGALALDEYANFTSLRETGKATVYRYEVKSNYNWTSPSWNSPGEQASGPEPLGVGRGYNTETPREGNVFLLVFIRLVNTGNGAVYAPSPWQFVVSSDGKLYNYSSVHDSGVIIDTVPGTQYDYQLGYGGTGGYVQPGESNQVDGYLIYEIPRAFSPATTYVISNLDYQTRAVWRLG